MKRLLNRKWSIAIVLSLIIIVGLVISFFLFLREASSGTDPAITYRAYHLRVLSNVAFAGCEIRMGEPWFPKLSSYKSLIKDERELAFVNVDAPVPNGKALSFSFVRGLPEMRHHALTGPVKIGKLTMQLVKPEFRMDPDKGYAWLPDSKLYVISQSEQMLKDGLFNSTIDCNGQKGQEEK